MHRYISTDSGLECFECGMVLDYSSPDDPTSPYPTASTAEGDTLEEAARSLAFGLCRSGLSRAHHFILEGRPLHSHGDDPRRNGCCDEDTERGAYALQCAYDGTYVDGLTIPADVNGECTGA